MTISLTTVQRLLVVSALIWALLPTWGGFFFLASWLLMFAGTRRRTRKARQLVAEHVDNFKTLTPEARTLMQRFALAYVWPKSAEGWGTTWQMTGFLAVLLAGVFALRALLVQDAWHLLLLLPLAAQLLAGGAMARHLKVNERVLEDLKEFRTTHDTTVTLLRLKTTVGQWPPEPSPDPEPSTPSKPSKPFEPKP